MSGFFDDLVAATTTDGPVDSLIADGPPEDRQAVRTGAVLASAAVVSELARLTDGGGRWTWQRLLRPAASAAGDRDDPERSGSLTRILFGERVGQVAGVIARDAPLAPAEAERALGISTAAAASLLADRMARGSQPDLRAEADALAASGWRDWLAALHPGEPPGPDPTPSTAGPEPVAPDAVAPQPIEAEPVAPDAVAPQPIEAEPVVAGPVAPQPSLGEPVVAGPVDTLPIAPAPLDERAQERHESLPPEDDDERPSRRLLLAGVATVVVAALVALAVSTRFGGDDAIASDAGATSLTTAESAPEGTEAEPTDTTEPAPAAPVTTAATVPVASTSDPAAPVEPTTYQLALVDPQGSSDAAGTARLDLDPTTGQICYQFQVAGLTDPFPGHIHAAPTGASGGITVDFEYLTGPAPSGCVDSFPADVANMIRHPERHYVELHDTEDGFGIRSRLAEVAPGTANPGSGTSGSAADTAATIVLGVERVVLQGEVPDEATRSTLVAGTADLAGAGFEVVDELTVRAGAPAPSGRVMVEEPLLFPFDSNELADDAARSVDQLARILELRPQWRVTLVGNTDGLGDVVYNLTLSLQRAIAARNALVGAGVPPEAVTIRGDGPFAPVADNDTPDGRTRNRRIDVVITTTP